MEFKKKEFGLTNDIYVNDVFFVKETREYVDKFINRENEFNFWEIKNLPKLFIRPIEFKKGKSSKIKFFNFGKHQNLYKKNIDEVLLDQVVNLISQLHNVPVSDKIESFDPIKYLNFFKDNIKQFKFEIAEDYVKNVLNNLPTFDKSTFVTSHNDLVPGNFIFMEKKLFLIDFEYISNNHFLFDIASFISETIYFSPKLINYFINKCISLNIMTIDNIPDLEKIINYQNLLWMHWANYMYEHDPKEIYLEIIKSKESYLVKED